MTYRVDDDHPHVDWHPRDKDPVLVALGHLLIIVGVISLMWVIGDGADGRLVGSTVLIGIGSLIRWIG